MTTAAANFTVRKASSIGEAIECFATTRGARFVAGGTALQLEWANGIAAPSALVALNGIADLKGITHRGDTLRLGALTPLGELERDRDLRTMLPLLAAAIQDVAAPSVRHLATLGGNVAGRTGCLIPALLALDATLSGVGPQGTWRRSLNDWLLGDAAPGMAGPDVATPGDIITAVEVTAMRDNGRWTARKIGRRATFSPSVIGVAGLLQVSDGRISVARLAVGGGIVPPARLVRAEAWLQTQAWETVDWASLHERLTAEINAPDDAFRSARYRRLAASNALVSGLAGRLPGHRSPRAAGGAAPGVGEIRLARLAQPARWHARPDGAAKVAGSFRYLTDHRTPDMLVGRILRAGHAHARILSIDTTRAEALPGVVAVVTHRDVPGLNAFGIIVQDQPALCHDVARYEGDVIAAVAAVDAATAEAALALIDVRYESLPVVTDPLAALGTGAPPVHDAGNLQRLIEYARGDVDAAFAACTHTIEECYVTRRQMHGFMETEGGWATVDAGTLFMHAGGQHALRDRQQLARILALPVERIRVVTSPTGGAFGGKDELTVQPALGLLALKARRPVRLQLSRAESVLAGTKRHPMTIRMRTGCDAEGRLLAQDVDVLADAGAYASLGPCVLETAMEHAAGTYEIAHVKTRGRLAYTNNGVGGAFRGFGANQMNYAVECQMDRLAARCGLSPVEFRRRNLKRPKLGFFGQPIAPSERLEAMLTAAAASPLWALAGGAASDEVIGVGMAMNHHGNGLGSTIPDSGGGRLRLARDGRIEACFSLDEMGQGLLALVVGAASTELGCGRDDIRPVIGEATNGPDSGSTTAARGTYVVWRTLRMAAPTFADQLCTAAATLLTRDATELKLGIGGIIERPPPGAVLAESPVLLGYAALAAALAAQDLPSVDAHFDYPRTDYMAGNARLIFASGACIARVAVSRITGEVRVLDLDQRSAAGPVVDVAAYLGQLEGGAVQGIGLTLTEEAVMTQGSYVTRNFDTYLMPSIGDAPARMDVYALEELDAGDDYGPRGVGELGIGAVTPAIANAVFAAIGLCPTTIPVSPETILDAMAAPR